MDSIIRACHSTKLYRRDDVTGPATMSSLNRWFDAPVWLKQRPPGANLTA